MGGPHQDGTAVEHDVECRECGSAFVWLQRGSGRPPWYCDACRKAKKLARKQAARARQREAVLAQSGTQRPVPNAPADARLVWGSCGHFFVPRPYGPGRETKMCEQCRAERKAMRQAAKRAKEQRLNAERLKAARERLQERVRQSVTAHREGRP